MSRHLAGVQFPCQNPTFPVEGVETHPEERSDFVGDGQNPTFPVEGVETGCGPPGLAW